jgi:hypothetical protein
VSASQDREKRSPAAYIAAVLANAALLWLVNKVPDWNLRFVTDGYAGVLWALNLSILVQLVGNGILIVLHPRFLHYLGQAVFNAVSVLATVLLVSVYPFDFSHLAEPLDTIVKIALVIGAVGTGISGVVNLFRAIGSLVRHDDS